MIGTVPLFGKTVALAVVGASILSSHPAHHQSTTKPLTTVSAKHVAVRAQPRHVTVRSQSPKINTGATIIGGNPNTYISEAMRLTGVHGPDWRSGLSIIAQGESVGNQLVDPSQPGYYCDSNCEAGTPSEGMMQTIQQTMDQYHQPGTSHNMLNPVADAAASINYIRDRYHSIDNVPGVRAVREGGHYVGY